MWHPLERKSLNYLHYMRIKGNFYQLISTGFELIQIQLIDSEAWLQCHRLSFYDNLEFNHTDNRKPCSSRLA